MLKIFYNKQLTQKDKTDSKYLWETGFVSDARIFSPLFSYYLAQKEKQNKKERENIEFSKKEHALFLFLKLHVNSICEREKIVEAVWPEAESFGVSDWAIDRLVARVRHKLKLQKSPFEIKTIKTRGYKLISLRE